MRTFADQIDLFAHKLSRLRRGGFPFPLILAGTFNRFLFGHALNSGPECRSAVNSKSLPAAALHIEPSVGIDVARERCGARDSLVP